MSFKSVFLYDVNYISKEINKMDSQEVIEIRSVALKFANELGAELSLRQEETKVLKEVTI